MGDGGRDVLYLTIASDHDAVTFVADTVITTHQPSMTEWFAAIGDVEESNAFREEDNRKVDRLETLYQEIGLPHERPEEFEARDLFTPSPEFQKILDTRGEELCAIRLVPKFPDLPKLRQRGRTIRESYQEWLLKQDINPENYIAYLCPHSDTLDWSLTMVIKPDVIFGEIIRGMHSQLTHGETKETLYQFRYDFKTWQWSEEDSEARRQIERMIELLTVHDAGKRERLGEKLQSTFTHDVIEGYFEATVWPGDRMFAIDYNRVLPRHFAAPSFALTKDAEAAVSGTPAFVGKATGRVRIVAAEQIGSVSFEAGDILVTDNTDVRFLPLMKLAGAIVTNRGGILSHAAIVSRELGRPCIIGTKIATKVLKDGDEVEVDAERGIVKITRRAP